MRENVTFAEKDSLKSLLMIKIIRKLETIGIFLCAAYSICNLRFMCLMKFRRFLATVQIIIIILL